SDVATEVSGLAGRTVAITVGGEHSCALSEPGGVACWGWNKTGQLGDGTTVDRESPTPIEGLASGVRAIAGGGRHTCALMEAGGARCWGIQRAWPARRWHPDGQGDASGRRR